MLNLVQHPFNFRGIFTAYCFINASKAKTYQGRSNFFGTPYITFLKCHLNLIFHTHPMMFRITWLESRQLFYSAWQRFSQEFGDFEVHQLLLLPSYEDCEIRDI